MFALSCSRSLSCMNKCLAIDSGGYLCTNIFAYTNSVDECLPTIRNGVRLKWPKKCKRAYMRIYLYISSLGITI